MNIQKGETISGSGHVKILREKNHRISGRRLRAKFAKKMGAW